MAETAVRTQPVISNGHSSPQDKPHALPPDRAKERLDFSHDGKITAHITIGGDNVKLPFQNREELEARIAKLSSPLSVDSSPITEPIPPAIPERDEAEYKQLHEREHEVIEKLDTLGRSIIQTWDYDTAEGSGMGHFLPSNFKLWGFYGGKYESRKTLPLYWKKQIDSRGPGAYQHNQGSNAETQLNKDLIPETVVITPFIKESYEKQTKTREVSIPKKKFLGIFGKGDTKTVSVTHEADVVVGHEPLTVRETIGLDSDEPCYVVRYKAPPISALGASHFDLKDGSGRSGNYFDFKLYVPKSVAQEMGQLLQKDPTFIRKIIAAEAKHYRSSSINPYAGKPLYEGIRQVVWDNPNIAQKVYLVDKANNPEAGNNVPLGKYYDPELVIPFTKTTVSIDGKKIPFGIPSVSSKQTTDQVKPSSDETSIPASEVSETLPTRPRGYYQPIGRENGQLIFPDGVFDYEGKFQVVTAVSGESYVMTVQTSEDESDTSVKRIFTPVKAFVAEHANPDRPSNTDIFDSKEKRDEFLTKHHKIIYDPSLVGPLDRNRPRSAGNKNALLYAHYDAIQPVKERFVGAPSKAMQRGMNEVFDYAWVSDTGELDYEIRGVDDVHNFIFRQLLRRKLLSLVEIPDFLPSWTPQGFNVADMKEEADLLQYQTRKCTTEEKTAAAGVVLEFVTPHMDLIANAPKDDLSYLSRAAADFATGRIKTEEEYRHTVEEILGKKVDLGQWNEYPFALNLLITFMRGYNKITPVAEEETKTTLPHNPKDREEPQDRFQAPLELTELTKYIKDSKKR